MRGSVDTSQETEQVCATELERLMDEFGLYFVFEYHAKAIAPDDETAALTNGWAMGRSKLPLGSRPIRRYADRTERLKGGQ